MGKLCWRSLEVSWIKDSGKANKREHWKSAPPKHCVKVGGGVVVSRQTYQVPWPNSLWHLDGHHSLIRWKIVIHGCIDGFSRRIIFLRRNSNNLADTVLDLFQAVQKDENLWPSRKRVEKGVEKVLVCDAMVQARGG